MAVQLTAAWWKKNKQVGVTGKELMTALAKFEKKKKTAVASRSEKDWDDVSSLLDEIDRAADKTKTKCNAKTQKKTVDFLDQMKKQTSLERKTAVQMIHSAKANVILQKKVVESRKLVETAKKSEKTPGQVMKILTPLAKSLPKWVKEKDLKNLSETLRTLTKVKGEVKKMSPVTDGNYLKELAGIIAFSKKSVPTEFDAWVNEIKAGNAYCQKVSAEAKKVSGDFKSLNEWFEKQLMALKKQ